MTVRARHAVAVRNKIRVLLKICRFVLGVVIGGIAITFRQDITIIIIILDWESGGRVVTVIVMFYWTWALGIWQSFAEKTNNCLFKISRQQKVWDCHTPRPVIIIFPLCVMQIFSVMLWIIKFQSRFFVINPVSGDISPHCHGALAAAVGALYLYGVWRIIRCLEL